MKSIPLKLTSLAAMSTILVIGAVSASASILLIEDSQITDDHFKFVVNGGTNLATYAGSVANAPALVSRGNFSYINEGTDKNKFLHATSLTNSAWLVFGWDFSETNFRPNQVAISAPLNFDFASPKVNFVYSWSPTGNEGSWEVLASSPANSSYNFSNILTLTDQPDKFFLKLEVLPAEGRTNLGYTIQWGRSSNNDATALSVDFTMAQVPEASTTALLVTATAFGLCVALRRRSRRN